MSTARRRGLVSTHTRDVRHVAAVEAKGLLAARPLDVLINNAAGNFLCKSEALAPGALEAVLGIVLKGSALTIDGGEGLKGAGQLSFLRDMMIEEDWQALRPGKAG